MKVFKIKDQYSILCSLPAKSKQKGKTVEFEGLDRFKKG